MSYISWTPFVFLRYVVFLVIGILVQIYWGVYSILLVGISIFSFVLFIVFYFTLSKHNRYVFASLFGLLSGLFLVTSGIIITYHQTDTNHRNHIIHSEESILWYKARVVSEVIPKPKSYKAELEIDQIKTQTGWRSSQGKILVYQSKKDSLLKLEYGDVVLVKGSPQVITSNFLPGEFDYKKYLSYQQIHHQQFIAGNYFFLKRNEGNRVIAFSIFLRQQCDLVFKKYIKGKREYALASALVLGIKEGLDEDIKNAYSRAGVMHVLAVSGMHVAILFQLLLLGFGRLKRIKKGPVLFGLISLIFIWLFAFVTGLSASVLRAVVMFSFILGAQIFKKQKNTYNNLALSAFCLLIYNPYFIKDIGFQLSYLAVFGIVYLYPKVYNFLDFKSRIADYFWTTMAMSIVAQIATGALSVFYFHQFPTYFLLANLFVIFSSVLILYGGIALLLFSWVPFIPEYLGMAVEWIIKGTNYLVFVVESLPFSVIGDLKYNEVETLSIYLAIVFILLLFHARKIRFLVFTSVAVLVFTISSIYSTLINARTKSILVYKNRSGSAVELRDRRGKLLLNSHTMTSKVKEVDGLKLLVWNDKSLVIVDKRIASFPRINKKVTIDLLIVQNNTLKDFKEVIEILEFKTAVVDASNSYRNADKLVKNGTSLNISVYSVPHNGPYVWNFKD